MTNACAKCNCETSVVHCCGSRRSCSSISRRGSGIISYSLILRLFSELFITHDWNHVRCALFFFRNRKILYSDCSNAKYSLFIFYFKPLFVIPLPPPSILMSTWLDDFFCRCCELPPSVNWFPANNWRGVWNKALSDFWRNVKFS